MAGYDFDLLIAGAGPAGCTLALHMGSKGYKVGIIEKNIFPGHKTCGDALSGKVVNVMKRLPGNVYGEFLANVVKIPSYGIRFIAPNHRHIDVPFLHGGTNGQTAPGFVCRRDIFDSFMFNQLKQYPNITVIEGKTLEAVEVLPDCVVATTGQDLIRGKVMAGADGVHSTVRKCLYESTPGKKHFCVGIRGYYENVSGLHPDNYIELIFLKQLLPGYFWIFPSSGGLVNAGFGMLQSRISNRKENLSKILRDIIHNDPVIAPRFKNARAIGKPGAHTLPLGTYHMKRAGNRFLLLGDAAFLVDPFSGEGIGNAMASGEIAASVLDLSLIKNDFSADTLGQYDKRINKRFSGDFRTLGIMQRLAGSAALVNLVVGKAQKNGEILQLLSAMYTNPDMMKKLTAPGFYARLLFK